MFVRVPFVGKADFFTVGSNEQWKVQTITSRESTYYSGVDYWMECIVIVLKSVIPETVMMWINVDTVGSCK